MSLCHGFCQTIATLSNIPMSASHWLMLEPGGIELGNFLKPRVLLAKSLGLMLVLGAAMPVGKERTWGERTFTVESGWTRYDKVVFMWIHQGFNGDLMGSWWLFSGLAWILHMSHTVTWFLGLLIYGIMTTHNSRDTHLQSSFSSWLTLVWVKSLGCW